MSRLYPIGGAFTLEDARKGVDDVERNVYQPILLLQPAQREAHRHRGKARDERGGQQAWRLARCRPGGGYEETVRLPASQVE